MSIPTQIGVNSQGSPIYRFDAIPNKANPGPFLNAADFAQPGDGGDFALAVNRAIVTVGTQGGGTVLLPPYPMTQQTAIVCDYDNVELRGSGWNSQLIAGSNFPSGQAMIWFRQPSGGGFRGQPTVRDLWVYGNSQAGIHGIQFDSTYHGLIDHVHISYVAGNSIYLNGTGPNTGAYTIIRDSHIEHGPTSTSNGVYTNFSEWFVVEGCLFDWFSTAGATAMTINNGNVRIVGTGFDANDTAIYLSYSNYTNITGCQFERGYTRFVRMRGNTYTKITGSHFGTRATGGTGTNCIDLDDGGNKSNVIDGCTFNGGGSWTNAIAENANLGSPGNTYSNNDTGGMPLVLHTGTSRGNRGYNPRGTSVAQPAVPASGTAQTNTTGVDCMVFLTGGTFTANHQIGGQSIGNSTATVLRVPAGQTVTLTYSAAPTWVWVGD